MLLICSAPLFAQTSSYSQYNTANNTLPGNDVYSIVTDESGYTWMATDKGICRYNGTTIEWLTKLDSVADRENINMFYDGSDYLYLLGYGGRIARINTKTLTSVNINEQVNEPRDKKKFPAYYGYKDRDGSIVFMKGGYYLIDKKAGSPVVADNSFTPLISSYTVLLHDFNIHAADADINCATCKPVSEKNVKPSLTNRENRATRNNSFIVNNKIFYKKNNALYLLYNGDEHNMRMPVMNYCIRNNDLYIPCFGNRGYLLKYSGYLSPAGSSRTDTLFKGNYLTDVSFDKTGQMWIGSIGSGIFMIRPTDFYIKEAAGTGAANEEINNITFLKGVPLLNTGTGMFIHDASGNPVRLSTVNNNDGFTQQLRFMTTAAGTVINARDLYIEEVALSPKQVPSLKLRTLQTSFIQNTSFKDYVLTADGMHLIFCTGGNVYFSDLSYNHLRVDSLLQSKKIFCMDILNDSILYLGTSVGVTLYNTKSKKITPVCAKDETITGLALAQGTLWYTQNNKLETHSLSPGPDSEKTTAVKYFLRDRALRIQKTDEGFFILANRRLVFLYKKGNMSPVFFDMDQTSLSGTLTAANIYNGQLWISVANKLYKVSGLPDSPGNVFVTTGEVSLNGKRVSSPGNFKFLYTAGYTINISIDIFGPQTNIEKRYRVFKKGDAGNATRKKLDGNNLLITGLSPGSYQWEIETVNNVTRESQLFTGFFTIEPLWYQTLAFRLAVLLTVVSFAFFIFYIRSLILERKEKKHQKYVTMEQHFLLSQMNPHFMNNALSAIQSEILEGNSRLATRYLNKYAELTRLVLENSRSNLVPLHKDLRVIDNYLLLQKIRFHNRFDYTLLLYPDAEIDEALIPPMLIQPFVENVFEHAFKGINYKGNIQVEVKKKEDSLVVLIEDNGKGFTTSPDKNKKKSLSTIITNERLKLLAKETKQPAHISVRENTGKPGITVIITIPLQYDK